MNWNICKVKNISGGAISIIRGFADGEEYTIPDSRRSEWVTSDEVIEAIVYEEIQIGSSIEYFDSYSDQINWLKNADNSPINIDKRHVIHATPRFLGTYTYFTGYDDNHNDPHAVGGSSNVNRFVWNHSVSGDNPDVVYGDFNTIINRTFVRQGDIMWKDAVQDALSVEIVPKTTDYTSGSGTSYDLYGGFLIIPAAPGSGGISVDADDMVLVQVTPNEFGDMAAGYWDADWNESTKEFDNVQPNYTGEGEYNMFGAEVVLHRFMNKRPVMGTGMKDCKTEDVAQLGHGMRVKISAHTMGTDHAWSGAATFMLYRAKTC